MSSKSKKSSTAGSKKVNKQDNTEHKWLLKNIEVLCQTEIAKVHKDFDAKIKNIEALCKSEIRRLQKDFETKIKNETAEFQLAVTQIPREILSQMKMGDVAKLAQQFQEGASANAVDDASASDNASASAGDSESDSDISIAQTYKKRARCSSADAAAKPKSTRSSSRAPSLKKAESIDVLTEKPAKKQTEIYYKPLGGRKKITNITPKVDLSKPLAGSSMRKPLPGELLVSLSGSPVDYSSPLAQPDTTITELKKAGELLRKTLRK